MEVSGERSVQAPLQVVWDALHDPEILRKCTPGCRSLKASERADGGAQTVYDAEMQVGVALVKGTFKGTVTIVDETPLEAYRVAVRASGGIGFSHIDGALRLAHDDGGTAITYTGNAQVGGPIAGVGQRVLGGFARKQIERFFSTFEQELAARDA